MHCDHRCTWGSLSLSLSRRTIRVMFGESPVVMFRVTRERERRQWNKDPGGGSWREDTTSGNMSDTFQVLNYRGFCTTGIPFPFSLSLFFFFSARLQLLNREANNRPQNDDHCFLPFSHSSLITTLHLQPSLLMSSFLTTFPRILRHKISWKKKIFSQKSYKQLPASSIRMEGEGHFRFFIFNRIFSMNFLMKLLHWHLRCISNLVYNSFLSNRVTITWRVGLDQ